MAWTTPITFVSNTVLTAAQLNTYLRDNMMETMPARATTAGSYFVTQSQNTIRESMLETQSIAASTNAITDTEYVDPPTGSPGPSVTVNVQSKAFVFLRAAVSGSASTGEWMSYQVSGATESDAQDNRAIMIQTTTTEGMSGAILHQLLTPGETTFTAKYRVSGTNSALFSNRTISVMPF